MTKIKKSLLACCIACLILFTSVCIAEEVPAERLRLLAIQSSGNEATPSELTAVLSVLPMLDFDYVAYYDEGHFSICNLSLASDYASRSQTFSEWVETLSKARARNSSHVTLWNGVMELEQLQELDLSQLDVIWLPEVELVEEQCVELSTCISRLVACGGRLRVYTAVELPYLYDQLEMLVNVEMIPAQNGRIDIVNSLLSEAGYYHATEEAIKTLLRRTEVHPADIAPGQTVLVDWCPTYEIVGESYRYQNVQIASADTQTGIAVIPATVVSAEPSSEFVDSQAFTDMRNVMVVSSDSEVEEGSAEESIPSEPETEGTVANELDNVLTHIVQEHQLCWYFRPSENLQLQMQLTPEMIPFDTEDNIVLTIALSATGETSFESGMCESNLLDDSAICNLSAVLIAVDGTERVLTLEKGEEKGTYTTMIERAASGEYRLEAKLNLRDVDYSYPALSGTVIFEDPVEVTATAHIEPIRLVIAPLLWHDGESQIELQMHDYFSGSFLPVECRNYDAALVQIEPSANECFRLSAVKEGKTCLFFLARDGKTGITIPVEIMNGQKLVFIEAGAGLVLLLLVLYMLLYARFHQPRFRKGEQMRVEIDGKCAVVLPLKSYKAAGVSLWRLLVIGGCAGNYKQDKVFLKGIVFIPLRNQVIVKQSRSKQPMVTGYAMRFESGTHVFEVVLEAARLER